MGAVFDAEPALNGAVWRQGKFWRTEAWRGLREVRATPSEGPPNSESLLLRVISETRRFIFPRLRCSPGQEAQLVRVRSQYAKVVGLIQSQPMSA